MLYVIFMLVGGGCLAAYSAICASLTPVMGVIETSFFAFLVAAIVALIVRMFSKSKGSFIKIKEAPKWSLLGGAFGVTVSIIMISATMQIGVTINTLASVLAKMFFAAVLDSMGWMEMPKIKITKNRIIGLVVMAAGLVISNISGLI